MGKSAPKPPDYAAAAREQAESSREVTDAQTWANRPTQTTPWGTISWDAQGATDPATQRSVTQWTQNLALNPASQRALDAQLGLTAGRSELAGSMLTRAQNEYGQPVNWNQFSPMGQGVDAAQLQSGLDFSGAPALPDVGETRNRAEDAIYGRAESRLDPRFQQSEADLRNRLYNQGLREGDAAYQRELDNFGRTKNDAYQAAMMEAIMGGGVEAQRDFGMGLGARQQAQQQASQYQTALRQQQIAEEMQRRGFSLNEINAVITGQQVQQPNMPNFTNAQRSEGLQSLAAAQMQGQANLDSWNAEQAAMQGMMSGVGDLAGGFMPFGFG